MEEKLATYISAVKKQQKYVNSFKPVIFQWSSGLVETEYKLYSTNELITRTEFDPRKDPVYSPDLTEEELNALHWQQNCEGGYLTYEESIAYLNELILRLNRKEVYGDDKEQNKKQ